MIRSHPRRRDLTHFESRAIHADAAARRFTHCTVVAMLAVAGLAFGLGLVALADWWSGARILPLMFAV